MTSPMELSVPDLYATLRVGRHASAQDLRLAYRRMAQEFHPDRYAGEGDSAALMAHINQAYETLSSPDRRASYDGRLLAQEARIRRAPRTRHAALQASWQHRLESVFGWPAYVVAGTLAAGVVALAFMALRGAPSVPGSMPEYLAVAATPVLEQDTPEPLITVADPVPLVAARDIGAWPKTVSPRVVVLDDAAEPMLKLVSARSIGVASLQRYRGVAVVSARAPQSLE